MIEPPYPIRNWRVYFTYAVPRALVNAAKAGAHELKVSLHLNSRRPG